MQNKALHWTGIPLRSIPASELGRYAPEDYLKSIKIIRSDKNILWRHVC